jgi:Dehydrogenases (flavoproteins)
MDEDIFDAIVVGGGIAGSVCAYQLAKAGYQVVQIERGSEPGSKNLSGGVFYCRVMEQVFPHFVEEAPVERHITRNCLMFLNRTSAVTVDYWDQRLDTPAVAVSVLRSTLDAWLAQQCEEVGVMVMPGVKVDAVIREGNRVVGVRAGEDELRAHIVIVADGVNSFLSREAGFRRKEPTKNLAVGVKSVIGLPAPTIAERFQLAGDTGTAYAVVGDCTEGVAGGGFLYTNRDSLSIGVVLRLDDLARSGKSSSDIHDHFLQHPAIAPYLEGGELREYGCHLVAEGGKEMNHDLVRSGMIVVGDAAGFTLNTGFTVRGMDLAAGSAVAAATVAAQALEAQDYSEEILQRYYAKLDRSFVGQDMATYANAPAFLENPRMYGAYGELAADILFGVYNHDLRPRRHLVMVARQALKGSGIKLTQLMKDGLAGVRAL